MTAIEGPCNNDRVHISMMEVLCDDEGGSMQEWWRVYVRMTKGAYKDDRGCM
jgi:hypothetical protein